MKKAIFSPTYISLVKWLKEARLSHGMSMRDLADKLDEPHTFVQKIESMERRLDIFEYVEVCRALGLNPKKGIDLLNS